MENSKISLGFGSEDTLNNLKVFFTRNYKLF